MYAVHCKYLRTMYLETWSKHVGGSVSDPTTNPCDRKCVKLMILL